MRCNHVLSCSRALVLSCWLCAVILHGTASAQPDDDREVTRYISRTSGNTLSVRLARPLADPAGPERSELERAVAFLAIYGHELGLNQPANEVELVNSFSCLAGQRHSIFQRVHRGVPVRGQIIRIHHAPEGGVIGGNARLRSVPPDLDPSPAIPPQAALARVQQQLPVETSDAVLMRDALVVFNPAWNGGRDTGARLCFELALHRQAERETLQCYVDAHSAELIHYFFDRHDALSREVRRRTSNAEPCNWPILLQEGGPIVTPLPVGYTVAMIQSAYDYMGDWHRFFLQAFQRDSIDGNGAELITVLNGTDVAELGWVNVDPSPPPGCRQYVNIGIGNPTPLPDDIIAHELTHGFASYTVNFFGGGQSGALNEACADVFGELVDLFNGNAAFPGPPGGSPAWPTTTTGGGLDAPNVPSGPESACAFLGYRWKKGEQFNANCPPIDLWRPHCNCAIECAGDVGYPERVFDTVVPMCPPCSGSGLVHRWSAPVSHGFALICDGTDSLPGGVFNGVEIEGIGPIKTAALLHRAMTVYLAAYPSQGIADFEEMFYALVDSAHDLAAGDMIFDPRDGAVSDKLTNLEREYVKSAFEAVEIHLPFSCP